MEKDLEGKDGGNGGAKQDRDIGKMGLFAQAPALSFYVHLQVSVLGTKCLIHCWEVGPLRIGVYMRSPSCK